MIWKDRRDAGRHLADRLASYRNGDAVVLAIPRGGVLTGHEVACRLSLPLDIVVVRKIGHPTSPEYAIGAVNARGATITDEAEVSSVDKGWLKEEIAVERKEAIRRSKSYRKGIGRLNLHGKVAIIVDDGIATGFTMKLAVRTARSERPSKVIVAVPVASPEALASLQEEADEVIVLDDPLRFKGAVGSHYEEFPQVDDDEVIGLLHSTPIVDS